MSKSDCSEELDVAVIYLSKLLCGACEEWTAQPWYLHWQLQVCALSVVSCDILLVPLSVRHYLYARECACEGWKSIDRHTARLAWRPSSLQPTACAAASAHSPSPPSLSPSMQPNNAETKQL